MTDIASYLGFAAGSLAGVVHATMLWRSSHRLSMWTPLLGMLRLGLVAMVLVAAAVYGQILTTAAGWAICFAVCAVLYFLRHATSNEQVTPESNATD